MATNPTSLLPNGVQVFERGWLSSNNILFIGSAQTALVDSGYATHAAQTVALVACALGGRPLDLLVNTHLHSDHCGGNAALKDHFRDLSIAIPPGEAEAVCDWDESKLSYKPTGQQCPRFGFDVKLIPGTEICLGDLAWQVHAAPGHDSHAVILFEPQSAALISGDALWERGFGVVFPEMWGEPSFHQVEETLSLIESLRPRVVIPGHGKVFDDVSGALSVARQRLAAFVTFPIKHARYAVKVLLKFKLLEQQRMSRTALCEWIAGSAYLEKVWRQYGVDQSMNTWVQALLLELAQSGAVLLQEDDVIDAG